MDRSRIVRIESSGARTMGAVSRGSARTAFSVRRCGSAPVEIIEGRRARWRFRPHYHMGDECVRITGGRALLRLLNTTVELEAGESIVVPAGAVHRFEPVDGACWSFVSEFVRPGQPNVSGSSVLGSRATLLLAERSSLSTDVASIAAACRVSAGYLSRVFRREFGTSLHNFHVVLAVQKAKALLRDGVAVVEAAVEAGFYDQAHLTREFVRTFGMTPGAYRSAWAMQH